MKKTDEVTRGHQKEPILAPGLGGFGVKCTEVGCSMEESFV